MNKDELGPVLKGLLNLNPTDFWACIAELVSPAGHCTCGRPGRPCNLYYIFNFAVCDSCKTRWPIEPDYATAVWGWFNNERRYETYTLIEPVWPSITFGVLSLDTTDCAQQFVDFITDHTLTNEE